MTRRDARCGPHHCTGPGTRVARAASRGAGAGGPEGSHWPVGPGSVPASDRKDAADGRRVHSTRLPRTNTTTACATSLSPPPPPPSNSHRRGEEKQAPAIPRPVLPSLRSSPPRAAQMVSVAVSSSPLSPALPSSAGCLCLVPVACAHSTCLNALFISYAI
jgi:hypothetical protein